MGLVSYKLPISKLQFWGLIFQSLSLLCQTQNSKTTFGVVNWELSSFGVLLIKIEDLGFGDFGVVNLGIVNVYTVHVERERGFYGNGNGCGCKRMMVIVEKREF